MPCTKAFLQACADFSHNSLSKMCCNLKETYMYSTRCLLISVTFSLMYTLVNYELKQQIYVHHFLFSKVLTIFKSINRSGSTSLPTRLVMYYSSYFVYKCQYFITDSFL